MEPKSSPEPEKATQSTSNVCSKCLMRSSMSGVRSSLQIPNPHKKARTAETGVQTSPPKDLSHSAEWANLLEVGCKTMLPDSPDSSLEMVGDNKSEKKSGTPKKPEYAQVCSCFNFEINLSSRLQPRSFNLYCLLFSFPQINLTMSCTSFSDFLRAFINAGN